MFNGCTSLTTPPDMSNITTIGGQYGCSQMFKGCTALTSAPDMSSLTTVGHSGCMNMFTNCIFNMTDDGTNLNFDFPVPITAGTTTYSTAYDVAQWMGNTNGFNE